jgi:hypothetical protein
VASSEKLACDALSRGSIVTVDQRPQFVMWTHAAVSPRAEDIIEGLLHPALLVD